MKIETLLMIKDTLLDNDGDFFTSGLEKAKRNLEETKRIFPQATVILSVICILSFLIRAFLF